MIPERTFQPLHTDDILVSLCHCEDKFAIVCFSFRPTALRVPPASHHVLLYGYSFAGLLQGA